MGSGKRAVPEKRSALRAPPTPAIVDYSSPIKAAPTIQSHPSVAAESHRIARASIENLSAAPEIGCYPNLIFHGWGLVALSYR
jgi:hypothetical protein